MQEISRKLYNTSTANVNVIVRIGGEAPFEFLKRAGVRMVRKDVPIGGENADPGKGAAAHAAAT